MILKGEEENKLCKREIHSNPPKKETPKYNISSDPLISDWKQLGYESAQLARIVHITNIIFIINTLAIICSFPIWSWKIAQLSSISKNGGEIIVLMFSWKYSCLNHCVQFWFKSFSGCNNFFTQKVGAKIDLLRNTYR